MSDNDARAKEIWDKAVIALDDQDDTASATSVIAAALREAVAAEREACAQIADDMAAWCLSKQDGRDDSVDLNIRLIAMKLPDVAEAIRARGKAP